MQGEMIELYHATLKENALSMTNSQEFICNEKKADNEFLGRGAYFYNIRQNAVDWTIKMYKDVHRGKLPQNAIAIIDKYRIVNADIEVKNSNILDLDNRINIKKMNDFANLVSEKLGMNITSDNYKPLAVLLNYMERENYLEGIDIVQKDFGFPTNLNKNLDKLKFINKKVICVKNNNIIKKMKIAKKINQKEFEDSMYFMK